MPHLHLALQNDDGESRPLPVFESDETEALNLLLTAEIAGIQLVPWGSNYTFAALIQTDHGAEQLAIYKPRAGEAPLYDFPTGTLCLREVAAYRLSSWLGWDIVPPTVLREGPHGIGSLQLYIAALADDEGSPFWRRKSDAVERMVLFDHIANNADRKIGHCLRDQQGRVRGIDHGLTFNEQPKLRTVLWQYAECPISAPLLEQLTTLHEQSAEIRELLADLLSPEELDAFELRVERLLQMGHYPQLNPRRNIPYGW